MFRTILVPTDGSDHAAKAVSLACDLAARYRAELVFLHVLLADASPERLAALIDSDRLTPPMREELTRFHEIHAKAAAGGYPLDVEIHVPQELLQAVGRILLDDAEAAAKAAEVEHVAALMRQGDPVARILELAAERYADLIVMGARGLSDFEALLVGSVSHKVASLAPCTCVTVK